MNLKTAVAQLLSVIELVFGSFHRYDWVQLGAAIQHPEQGKEIDLGEDARAASGVENASLKLVPWRDYGNPDILRQLLMRHKPDAILHFTDPRYWKWLYEMEAEVRENCPIYFYHIWDDLPDPDYNRDFYESCDWLGCISKQTYGIVKRVGAIEASTIKTLEDWQVSYVPHGIDPTVFKPTNVPMDVKDSIFQKKDYDFVVMWSNRNIRRKQASDVIWGFQKFVDKLPEDKKDKVCMVMHTQPIDENGTNLFAVKDKIAKDCEIIFSDSKVSAETLNYMYNLADCMINISGNEGFGLTTAEALMSGTPLIVNVTGGLQDQCGFKLNNKSEFLSADDYIEIGSLHNYRDWEDKVIHGEWVKPVWPKVQTMVGSVPTPYIIDDKVNVDDIADAIMYWYNIPKPERMMKGEQGREWMINEGGLTNQNMCTQLIKGMDTAFENWKPKKRYNVYKLK